MESITEIRPVGDGFIRSPVEPSRAGIVRSAGPAAGRVSVRMTPIDHWWWPAREESNVFAVARKAGRHFTPNRLSDGRLALVAYTAIITRRNGAEVLGTRQMRHSCERSVVMCSDTAIVDGDWQLSSPQLT